MNPQVFLLSFFALTGRAHGLMGLILIASFFFFWLSSSLFTCMLLARSRHPDAARARHPDVYVHRSIAGHGISLGL